MIRSDPVAEWKACGVLRQSDLDNLIAAGVPILGLAGDAYGGGFCVPRDRIVPHQRARRFEFARHDETAGEGVPALIVLALDAYGEPADLVAFAWRPDALHRVVARPRRDARRGQPLACPGCPRRPCHAVGLAPGGAPRGVRRRSGAGRTGAARRRHAGSREPGGTPPARRHADGSPAGHQGPADGPERRRVSAAPEAGMIDPGTVRVFCRMIHDAAAHALNGAIDPGMLQLDFLHPNGGNMQTVRFPIGAADAMADSAISAASNGLNVYVEGRTIDIRASAGRGKADATRGVFAFVDDSDGEKGKGGDLKLSPTWRSRAPRATRHNWILLDRALTPEQAEPLGRALRAWIGSDSATAKLTQPYRVAGTPNFPDARKRARGRVVSPTRILYMAGPVWSADDLAEVVPPAPETTSRARPGRPIGSDKRHRRGPGGRHGRGPVRPVLSTRSGRRSAPACSRPTSRTCSGVIRTDAPASTCKPYDRLAEEIARAWGKVAAKVEEEAEAAAAVVEPTYPSRAVPVEEARTAVLEAIEAHFAAGTGIAPSGSGPASARPGPRRARSPTTSAGGGARATRARRSTSSRRIGSPRRWRSCSGRRRDGARVPRPRRRRSRRRGLQMCLDMPAVEMAIKLHLTVSKACCKLKHPDTGVMYHCPFFGSCGYQGQIAETPDVWVGAHDLLFTAPGGLGEVGSVTIDEGFWQAGLRIATRGITLDDVGAEPETGRNAFEMNDGADIAAWRATLRKALQSQEELGGVQRRHLVEAGLDPALCGKANGAEWRLTERITFFPGMSKEARAAAAKAAERVSGVGRMSAVWRGAKQLLEADEGAVSGRMVLIEKNTEDGFGKARAVLNHSVRPVLERWAKLPVLLLDATLPSLDVLQRFFPASRWWPTSRRPRPTPPCARSSGRPCPGPSSCSPRPGGTGRRSAGRSCCGGSRPAGCRRWWCASSS